MKNNTLHSLANIPLRWMIKQCFEANTGIIFDTKLLEKIGLVLQFRPDASGPPVVGPIAVASQRITVLTREGEDRKDALTKIHDRLAKNKWWWILELFPLKSYIEMTDGSKKSQIR